MILSAGSKTPRPTLDGSLLAFRDPPLKAQLTRGKLRDREDMKQCWKFLDATSRSFAAVIKELEGDLGRVVSWPFLCGLALGGFLEDGGEGLQSCQVGW